ncbi:MAG: ABC transporter permease [Flavobacteriales bacterium]|nr:ABC transporter permease [Flavobacteriales bacterium]MCB9194420.1 ABC transporter permease [Flavobacteriales bacterium]
MQRATDLTIGRTGRSLGIPWSMVMEVAWKNVRLRYKSSLLGFLWTLLNPVLYLLIFLFIFSRAFAEVENYPVFALTGLILWTFFATTSAHVMGSLVENAHVLRSLAVPPLVFPLAQSLAGLFNLVLSFIPFAFILFAFGWRPHPVIILIVPVTLLFAGFVLGVSMALAALNVFFRDIGLLWNALLPAMFYITPIAYPPGLIPQDLRWIIELDPLHHYIRMFRTVVYEGRWPEGDAWVTTAGLTALALILGAAVFRRLRPGFIANY